MVDTAHKVKVQWSGVDVGEGRGVPLSPLGPAGSGLGPLGSAGVRHSAKVPPSDHVMIHNILLMKGSMVQYQHRVPPGIVRETGSSVKMDSSFEPQSYPPVTSVAGPAVVEKVLTLTLEFTSNAKLLSHIPSVWISHPGPSVRFVTMRIGV